MSSSVLRTTVFEAGLPVFSAGKLYGICVTELGHDELIAIMAPGHPWVGREYVSARDFNDEPLVLYDRQSPITERTLAFLFDEGVFPRIAVEIDHLEALKDLVRAQLGVAIVPRWSVLRELAAGALSAVTVDSPRMRRAWGLCYLEGQQQAGTVRALLDVCVETMPARLAQGPRQAWDAQNVSSAAAASFGRS